jgi:hypothetical protein
VTSNRTVAAKNVAITLKIPFREIANRYENANGAPYRDVVRTWDRLLERLLEWVTSSLATPEAGEHLDDMKLDEGRKAGRLAS